MFRDKSSTMTTSWQTIIEQQKTLSSHDDYSSHNAFTPLAELGVLHISGDDTQNFLQNLLTNDVNALSINQSQLSGFCNAKGRLFAVFLLIKRAHYYQIILPKSMVSILQQRLSMFVLRSKVTIEDRSETVKCIGLLSVMNNAISELHLSDNDIISYGQDEKRSLCILSQDQTDELLTQLHTNKWQLVSDKVWQQGNIEAGIPSIFPETKEKFTPQQVNLDLVNGVSFNKGCYPGQEVVARLHYLGKPSRRMFIAQAHTDNLPSVGDEVKTESDDVAGHIVQVNSKEPDSIQLLLSLKLSEIDHPLFINKNVAVTLMDKQFKELD